MLNWSTAAATGFIASAIIAISASTVLMIYRREKSRYALYLACAIFCMFFWSFFQAVSHVLLSVSWHLVSLYVTAPTIFFLIFALNYLTRDEVDPRMMSLASMGIIAIIFTSLEPDAVVQIQYPSGEVGLTWGGLFQITLSIFLLGIGIFTVYIVLKVYSNAPPPLKKAARVFLAGGIIMGLIPLFLVALFRTEEIMPGIEFILFAFGTLVMALTLRWEPKLAYVLPFKVLRLVVLETGGGIPLFSYTWPSGQDMVDEGLFSGMLQGVVAIVKESVRRGEVRSIEMVHATMLLQPVRQTPLVCVLVATRASRALRQALEKFSDRFFAEFSDQLENINATVKFYKANDIIDACFPFIP